MIQRIRRRHRPQGMRAEPLKVDPRLLPVVQHHIGEIVDNSINIDIIYYMNRIEEILAGMRQNAKGIRFSDLCKMCDSFFGQPRQRGTSHRVYKTPWAGDPRVNIQNDKGTAKIYQVRQVLKAIERLESQDASEK
jgi:hypothetical protein